MKFNYHGESYDIIEIVLLGACDGQGDRLPTPNDLMRGTHFSTGTHVQWKRSDLGMWDGMMNLSNREVVRRKMDERKQMWGLS